MKLLIAITILLSSLQTFATENIERRINLATSKITELESQKRMFQEIYKGSSKFSKLHSATKYIAGGAALVPGGTYAFLLLAPTATVVGHQLANVIYIKDEAKETLYINDVLQVEDKAFAMAYFNLERESTEKEEIEKIIKTLQDLSKKNEAYVQKLITKNDNFSLDTDKDFLSLSLPQRTTNYLELQLLHIESQIKIQQIIIKYLYDL